MSEQREMTLDEWVSRLPEFHLANKEYQQLKQRIAELKEGMVLTPCYECGTPVHELSPRSRCCKCEYDRAIFNEKENNQLREKLG